MPKTAVVIFAEEDGLAPLLAWMDGLPVKAQDRCLVRMERLGEKGHELRRPEADFLREGISELRAASRGVQYRMLYFFIAGMAVISHGLIKRGNRVPDREIDLAIERRMRFEHDAEKHTYRESES